MFSILPVTYSRILKVLYMQEGMVLHPWHHLLRLALTYNNHHDDQEGFFVLEGNGFVRLDNEEFKVKAGDSFIALPGVRHTMKTVDSEKPLKVFWFHSGI